LLSAPKLTLALLILPRFFPLCAQVTPDPYLPFRQGETVAFPGVTQYLGDLPPDIQTFPANREFHSLAGEGAELPGWDYSNPQAGSRSGFFSASSGLFYGDIPNPFGAAPFLPEIPGGFPVDWFDLPSAAWWGPQAAGGALVIRDTEFSDQPQGRTTVGIAGNIAENGFLEMQEKDFAFSASVRQNNSSADPTSFPAYGFQGKVLALRDPAWGLSLSALAIQESPSLYWTVFDPQLTWYDGQWFSASLKPYLAFSGAGDQTVQEGGGLLDGKMDLAGFAQSQWGAGFSLQNWDSGEVSSQERKFFLQNSEWADALGMVLAHASFRLDFSNENPTQFNWLAGVKMVQDDWTLFGEGSRSTLPAGDVLQLEAGLGCQSADRWRWHLEYLRLQLPAGNQDGGRALGEVHFFLPARFVASSLSLRWEGEYLQDPSGNGSLDSGAELDLFFPGQSRIWCLGRKPAGDLWFWEWGGEWRWQTNAGVYAYLSQGPPGEVSWPDPGFSSPTTGGLGFRGEF
jgi:hypothetical protein